jgi:hypothetical protein
MGIHDLKYSTDRIRDCLKGWHTQRKIVVIESDDWGSIRMPSKEVYERCLKAGYPVDKTVYERYDTLLSSEDLNLLFDNLTMFNDKNGNHPVITANCVVANPDFIKIRASNFETYHYELITETFKKYPRHHDNFRLWNEGIVNKIFFPQFHAREHLNVSLFMKALKSGDQDAHFGFENQMPGCIKREAGQNGNDYIEATKYDSNEDKNQKLAIYLEGLDLFEKLFGYRSDSVIPPNYTWSPDFNEPSLARGVRFFQGVRKMIEPLASGQYRYHLHYTGKRNTYGQLYLVRNSLFEPASMLKIGMKDPVGRCLKDISIAFTMKKPAIISSHRINYAGFIDQANRDNSLKMLNELLRLITKKWPDVEFMNSSQLGKMIDNGKRK